MRLINSIGRDTLRPEEASAVAAAARAGGVILFPTDTLYGLGADPGSAAGLAAVYKLKGRDPGKPLPVLLAEVSLIARYAAAIPAPWRGLMERFWPGPLTLLFPALAGLPAGIRSASGKVALRVPGSALCRAVLAAAGGSLTGTSANPAGTGGTGEVAVVQRNFGEDVAVFVHAGTLPPSPESTILDVDASGDWAILRAGVISETDLRLVRKRRTCG